MTAAPVAAGAVRPSVESRSKKNDRRGAARLARLAAAGGCSHSNVKDPFE